MEHKYFVYAEHVGAGDNYLAVPYLLTLPTSLIGISLSKSKLIALLAIRNNYDTDDSITFNSDALEEHDIDWKVQSELKGDYEIYSQYRCEYIKIEDMKKISESDLNNFSSFIKITNISLELDQIKDLL